MYRLTLDQSNLVKNMAAAFGQIAPNLIEKIKTNYKSQVEVCQSEERDFEEFDQKSFSKDVKDHTELVEK